MSIPCKSKTRKLPYNDIGHIFPDDWPDAYNANLELKERIFVEDIPAEVVERYAAFSRDELIEIARSPCQYTKGSSERQVVYRLRAVFGSSFPSDTGVSHIFNPKDSTDSKLGTPVFNPCQRNAKFREPEEVEGGEE